MFVSRKKNRSIPFGDRAEDERANSRTLQRRGRVYRKKTKNKKRANIVYTRCMCVPYIRTKGCARVVCRRHFNRPSFPPSNCPLPSVQRNFPRTYRGVYLYTTRTYIRLYGEHEWNYALYIIYIYIYICITYCTYNYPNNTQSCIIIFKVVSRQSFTAR